MRPKAWILSLSTVAMAAAMAPLVAAPAAESATPAAPASAASVTVVSAPAAPSAERRIVKVVRLQGQEAPAKRDMVVVKDAETGQFRAPNAEEWARMSADLDPLYRSDVGLEEVYYDDGTVAIRLGDRYQSMMLTHKDAQGRVQPTCTHDAQTAVDVITHSHAGEGRNDQ